MNQWFRFVQVHRFDAFSRVCQTCDPFLSLKIWYLLLGLLFLLFLDLFVSFCHESDEEFIHSIPPLLLTGPWLKLVSFARWSRYHALRHPWLAIIVEFHRLRNGPWQEKLPVELGLIEMLKALLKSGIMRAMRRYLSVLLVGCVATHRHHVPVLPITNALSLVVGKGSLIPIEHGTSAHSSNVTAKWTTCFAWPAAWISSLSSFKTRSNTNSCWFSSGTYSWAAQRCSLLLELC